MVIVITVVIIQCYIFIVMIIIGIIVIITTTRLIEFVTEDLAEGKQCCNMNNKGNKPQACERVHKADSFR